MTQLTVRKLDPRLVTALKVRAALNGRSAEAEMREILRAALEPPGPGFKEFLRSMPWDGSDDDSDFARSPDLPRDIEL